MKDIQKIFFQSSYLVSLFLCSSCNITPIVSTVKRWVLIILWRICERYEPCIFTGKNLLQACLKRRFLSWKYIGRQPYSEGIYSRAVHGVTFSFALDFLDLTTFLRQILGKIYSPDFLTTFYDNDLWFIPQQVRFLAGSFWTSRSPHETFLQYDYRHSL